MNLIIRIILSPIISLVSFLAMTILGVVFLFIGLILIIGKLLGFNIEDSYSDLLILCLTFITFPIAVTYLWIKEGDFTTKSVGL